MTVQARIARGVMLCAALALVLASGGAAAGAAGKPSLWLASAALAAVLLALPLRALVRGTPRAGIWYALLSTVFVVHGVMLTVLETTRTAGFVVLGSALVLCLSGGVFLRLASE